MQVSVFHHSFRFVPQWWTNRQRKRTNWTFFTPNTFRFDPQRIEIQSRPSLSNRHYTIFHQSHINTSDLGSHLLELFGATASFSFCLPSHELDLILSVHEDNGILPSGCQANETSADMNPHVNGGKAYGAFSNAVQIVLKENPNDLSNKDIVLMARSVLQKQGFEQHPCLYSSDEHSNSVFLNQLRT